MTDAQPQQESKKKGGRRPYSNYLAGAAGFGLVVMGGLILANLVDPYAWDRKYILSVACLVSGAILWIWVVSAKTKWIGSPTINMVFAVFAAVLTIWAFTATLNPQAAQFPNEAGPRPVTGP